MDKYFIDEMLFQLHERPLTPEEFAGCMREIATAKNDDFAFSGAMAIVTFLLEKLGYGDGVKILEEAFMRDEDVE